MIESELKIQTPEGPENINEKKKKRLFSGLRNRLLALATAGFITLGTTWERDLSEQFEIADKKEAIAEFIFEGEIYENTLNNFKDRIERKEPEFAKLAKEYKKAIELQLDNLKTEISEYDINSQADSEYDQHLLNLEQHDSENGIYYSGNTANIIELDHQIVADLRSDPNFLKQNHDFLKTNLDNIFWCLALLNDSKDSRGALTQFIKPPNLVFLPHASHGQPVRATTIPSFSSAQWHPKITVYPLAFAGLDRHLNANTYTNIFIHELSHAVMAGSWNGKKVDRKMGNDFADVLDEGRVQGLTYKIVRYLNRDNPNLKPIFEEADSYDQFLVIAEIMGSVARTHPNGDFLVEWQLGIIDYKTMLEHFKTAFKDLGLNDDIHKSIVNFKFGENKNTASIKFAKDLMAALKLNNVSLSEDFVRRILKREGNHARY